MSTIRSFIRREPVLLIAALAALVSCFFVPPDAAYWSYPDLRTLALLYCLMTVVAGLRQAGLFSRLAHRLCLRAGTLRAMGMLLVLMSFFSSMLITNDVALLTFVPFAVVVLGMAGQRVYELIWDVFCDWYIELVKGRLYGDDEEDKKVARFVLTKVLKDLLKFLHPFMPFITCSFWSASAPCCACCPGRPCWPRWSWSCWSWTGKCF